MMKWVFLTYGLIHLKTMYGFDFKPLFINFSLGFDYMNEMWWEKNNNKVSNLDNKFNPNFSLGLSYRKSNWISYHLVVSYGSTLTYLKIHQ